MNEEKRTSSPKTRVGKVVSDKMDKTVVVAIADRVAHPLYKKIVSLQLVSAADDLLVQRMGHAVLDGDDHGLIHLVGHHSADPGLTGGSSLHLFVHVRFPPSYCLSEAPESSF